MKYPPYSNITYVLDQCPAAILVYISLWTRQHEKVFSISKEKICDEYLTVFPEFYPYISLLKKSKILSFTEDDILIHFHLFIPEIKAHGNTLC